MPLEEIVWTGTARSVIYRRWRVEFRTELPVGVIAVGVEVELV